MLTKECLDFLKNEEDGSTVLCTYPDNKNIEIVYIDGIYNIFIKKGIFPFGHWYSRRLINIKKRFEKLCIEHSTNFTVSTKIQKELVQMYYRQKESKN